MKKSFWDTLPRPFFVLAPLLDVTDAPFRAIIAKYSKPAGPVSPLSQGGPVSSSQGGPVSPLSQGGPVSSSQGGPVSPLSQGGPDVFWTEFVSADGLMSKGREHLLHMLKFGENERPIVAQLFSGNPEKMRGAATLCAELGFDGIDINMGCPDKSVEKGGSGAALIRDIPLAKALIRAAKEGAGSLPVSVKTRLGYNKVEIETWIPALLEEGIAALAIHARTRKEMSKVPARWEHVARAVKIRDAMNPLIGGRTLIIGNGDVKDLNDARAKAAETKCDGVMLGRAIFGNPFLFSNSRELENRENREVVRSDARSQGQSLGKSEAMEKGLSSAEISERLRVMVEHTKLFEEMLSGVKSFAIMKKHFKAYAEGFPGAKDLRVKLMETKTAAEVEQVAKKFLQV